MTRASGFAVLFGAIALVAHAQPAPRGVIAGRVLDDVGDPVIAARVTVEKRTETGASGVVSVADTDDRGEYRVPGLPAGSFVVAVTTIGGVETRTIGTQTVSGPSSHKMYFPRAGTAAEAATLTLQPEDKRTDVDFVVPAAQATTQPFSVAGGGGRTNILFSPLETTVPRTGTSVIRGRVVTTDGRPLARAQVGLLLVSAARPTRDLMRADGAGGFEFRDLPPGTYRVVVSKPGYEPAESDAPPVGLRIPYSGRSITVTAGELHERVDVPLTPLATVSGLVLDDAGEPLQGASVQLLQIRYEAGRRQLVSANVRARVTDDLGRFRLYGLEAGAYVVSASIGTVSSADVAGYLPSYYPATSNPGEARFVSVRTSEAVAGIDITMARGRTARVAGRILDHAGTPTMGGTVTLRPRQRSSAVGVSVGARLTKDGQFEFPNVPPGEYVIQANRGRSNSWTEGEFGAVLVAVSGTDVTDLALQMSTGTSVSGLIRFDTLEPSKRPRTSAVELSAIPVDFDESPWNGFATANIGSDWQFQLSGLNGQRRLQLQSVPAGWALKTILMNGIDVTDRPIAFGKQGSALSGVEVVLTDRVSGLSGTVTDGEARPAGGTTVFAFSSNRDQWYPSSRFLRTASAGPDGTFSIQGLASGTYYLAAAARRPRDDGWQDPAFLEALRIDAVTFTISEGQQSSLKLRLPDR
jgi:hypothetical protein